MPLVGAALIAAALSITALALAGGQTLPVKLAEYRVTPATHTIDAGKVTFTVKNAGTTEHELVVIRTATKAAKLPIVNGKASQKGSVGTIRVAEKSTARLTLTLKRGHYALICNLGSHYMAGMRADLTVK
jgi:uncharacterized cupredoxin-like copper-binding protein